MKNFFKKLALVLALALVVTVVAPAAASKSEAASIAISSKSEDVSIGKSYNFNIKNKVKGSTYKWSTSDKSIATVNSKNGVAKGVKVGTATISCKITLPNKTTKTVKATLNVRPDATAVAINTSKFDTAKMVTGGSYDFDRTMTPSNSANKTYWIVKDASGNVIANTRTGVGENIMTSQGVFKPVTPGVYTIKAECWRSKTATVMRAESEVMTVNVALAEVAAISIEEGTFDDDTKGQKLSLKANGLATTSEALLANGYNVVFTVWDASNADVTTTVLKATDSEALADKIATGTYKVQVTITKSGVSFTSEKVTIKVANLDATATSVKSSKFVTKTGVYADSKLAAATTVVTNTMVAGETAELDEFKVVANGDTIKLASFTGIDITSSNPAVVYAKNNAGTVTLEALTVGSATITVKYGTVSAAYTINVKAEKRALNTISTVKSSYNIVNTGTAAVAFDVKDQYGNVIVDTASNMQGIIGSYSSDTGVATVASKALDTTLAADADVDGRYNITATGVKAGSANVYILYFNEGGSTFVSKATAVIRVTDNATAASTKLEVKEVANDDQYSKDLSLDLFNDLKVRLALNSYNIDNVKVSTATFVTTKTDSGVEYLLESMDTKIATVDASGDVTGVKAGSTDITVTEYKDGTKTGKTWKVKVTVTSSAPTITSVSYNTSAVDVKYARNIDYKYAFNVVETGASDYELKGINLSKASAYKTMLSVDNGAIYLDKNANKDLDQGDIVLGFIGVPTVKGDASTVSTWDAQISIAEGQEGLVIFSVVKASSTDYDATATTTSLVTGKTVNYKVN